MRAAPGETVIYRFQLSNPGNTDLTNVEVQETSFSGTGVVGPITCGSPPVNNGAVTLDVGAVTTCTASYRVTQADIDAGQIINVAIARGTSPALDETVQSPPQTTQVTVIPGVAALTIVKSTNTLYITGVGQPIPYEFLVTNTGPVTLTNVTVTDVLRAPASAANLGPITCGANHTDNGQVILAPAAAITCTATYTVSEADYTHGQLSDVATAAGDPPSGPTVVSPESALSIRVNQPLPVTGLAVNPVLWAGIGLLSLPTGTVLVRLTFRRRRVSPEWP